MWVLNKFLKLRKPEILSEALPSLYLHMKWTSIRKFYYVHIACFVLYLLSLTTLITWSSWQKDYDVANVTSNMSNSHNTSDDEVEFVFEIHTLYSKHKELWIFLYVLTLGATFLNTVGEFIQGVDEPKEYIRSMENVYEVIAISSSWIYLILVLFSDVELGLTFGAEKAFAAMAIFFAWIKMTFMIGSLPAVGIYASMSITVVKDLLNFFAVFLTTLIAFAFALHILLPKHPVFKNPFTSFLKILVMLIGEIDFNDTFTIENVEEFGVAASQGLSQLFFVALLFMVSIVIANLIIGLSVSNIDDLMKESEIYKMEKMVRQIGAAEKFFNQNLLSNLVPKKFRNKFEEGTKLFARLKMKGQPFTKVCIMPNGSPKTAKLGKMKYFTIYKFNEIEGNRGKQIRMELPESILEKALGSLKAKNELEDELEEMLDEFEKKTESSLDLNNINIENSISWKGNNMSKNLGILSNRQSKNKWRQARNRLMDKMWYRSGGRSSSESR